MASSIVFNDWDTGRTRPASRRVRLSWGPAPRRRSCRLSSAAPTVGRRLTDRSGTGRGSGTRWNPGGNAAAGRARAAKRPPATDPTSRRRRDRVNRTAVRRTARTSPHRTAPHRETVRTV